MNTKTMTQRMLHRNCYIIRLLLMVGMLTLLLLFQTSSFTYAHVADGPGGNVSDPAVRAVDIAEPAVVRILTQVDSRLTVNFPNSPSVTFPQDNTSYPLLLSGSGTFISSHGDILTADHVVNPPHDQELSNALDQTASQDIANYINQHSQPNSGQVTADQVAAALESGQLQSTPQYGQTRSAAFLSTSYTGPLSATSFQNLPQDMQLNVDRIEKESAVNDRDTAIVHVQANDTASVLLGSSTGVQPQDNLTIIGFPGNADVSNRPTDILTPSINKVIVSAIKTTDAGAPLIQVGGNVEQGDSGGPALDSKGNIVGIVSFSINSGNAPGNTNFLQASESAQQLIQSLNLDTTPGTFQKQWNQAFMDYASNAPGHWHKAQSELQKLQDGYPQFKAIAPYLTYANQQAQNETTTTSSSSTGGFPGWLIALLVLIVLLVLGLILFTLLRRRTPATATANGQVLYNDYNGRMSNTGYLPQPFNQSNPSHPPYRPGVPDVSPHSSAYGGSIGAFGGPPQASYGMQDVTPSYSSVPSPQPQQPLQESYPVYPPVQQPYSSMAQQGSYPQYPTYPSNNEQTVRQSQSISSPGNVQNAANSVSPSADDARNAGVFSTWPCGHLNRADARYCNVCGAPSPRLSTSSTPSEQTVRRYEQ